MNLNKIGETNMAISKPKIHEKSKTVKTEEKRLISVSHPTTNDIKVREIALSLVFNAFKYHIYLTIRRVGKGI